MNDDRLREALPFLRPRTEEPSGIVLALFILLCAALAGVVTFHLWRHVRQRRQLYERLAAAAAERGLGADDIARLARLARRARMANPAQLVQSPYTFDRIVGPHVNALVDADWQHGEIAQIERMRNLLGFDRIPPDQPLRSTRQIASGQTLMVWCEEEEGGAFFPWVVIERDERALFIAPLLKEDFAHYGPLAAGQLLVVRFWRAADTEYRFRAEVLSVDAEQGLVVLRHGDDIERLQQRDFYRIAVHFPIDFILVGGGDDTRDGEEESAPVEEGENGGAAEGGEGPSADPQRLQATVLDLSAGGLSVEVEAPLPPLQMLEVARDFTGPFPLAGLRCQLVQQAQVGAVTRVQLRFVEVPPAREAELVRHVYEHQIHSTS